MIPLKDNIPTDRFPVATVALILANVVVYLLSIRHGGSLWSGPAPATTYRYGAFPYELTHCTFSGPCTHLEVHGQASTPLSVLSSMFMHGGLLHIAGNMLFLWIFGNNVEDAMGRVKFVAFYLVGGVAALVLQTLVGPNSVVPTVGASGAIAAVLGAYILLYPRARVVTLVFIILFFTVLEIPAFLVLGFWFLLQLFDGAQSLSGSTGGGGGGVAYFAHVGGFAFGLLTIRLLATNVKRIPPRHPVY